MFEMTAAQQQAFQDGTGGVKAIVFNHLILFCIGFFATVWLLFIILGYWKNLQSHRQDLGDVLLAFAIAFLIYIAIGSMIFY